MCSELYFWICITVTLFELISARLISREIRYPENWRGKVMQDSKTFACILMLDILFSGVYCPQANVYLKFANRCMGFFA